MNSFKRLASDTAIYGTTSILGRILNWCLAPYYSFIFIPEVYAVVSNLYAWAAFFVVLLLYGMETSYFRYASKSNEPEKVYSTSLISVFFTSFGFVLLAAIFSGEIASFIDYPQHPEYITWFAIILGMDALTAIPFARMRIQNRPIKFMTLKLVGIVANIFFNIFFLTFLPWFLGKNPDSVLKSIYLPEIGVGYVFIANLLSSAITLLLLLPDFLKVSLQFNNGILKQMLNYGFPILIVGLAGVINQSVSFILLPVLIPENLGPMHQLGVYSQGVKLAVLMNMFIQAFRYAFEPFFFSHSSKNDDPRIYATIMKYFVIFGLIIFLGMVLYLDIIKVIIDKEYHEGLKVVPLMVMANLLFGIYFTLSLWYKLTDMTRYGAYISLIGAAITLLLNFLLIPVFGYMGSAITVFVCFLTMVIISYILGQKYYPVPYHLKRILTYFLISAILYLISTFTGSFTPVLKYFCNTLLMLIFFGTVFILEKIELMSLFKINKKK